MSGFRRPGESTAETAGRPRSWYAGHRSGHRGVCSAALVQILGLLVLAPFPVWILGRIALPVSLVQIPIPILLVPIPRAWDEKKQPGARKGVPSKEHSL